MMEEMGEFTESRLGTAPTRGEAEARKSSASTALAVAGVLLGTLLQSIDGSIVNVAVPQIQAQIGGPLAGVGWGGAGSAVAGLVPMPLCGGIAARVGVRPFFLAQVGGVLAGAGGFGLPPRAPSPPASRAV